MPLFRALLRRWLGRPFGQRREQLLDDELGHHLALETEKNLRAGMAPAEAARQARLTLGGVEQVKEHIREQRSGAWLEQCAQDVRYGLRLLRRRPGFTLAAVLTLALGIGPNIAMFSVVRDALLRPLPYPSADDLVVVWNDLGGSSKGQALPLVSGPDFADYCDAAQGFVGFAAASGGTSTLWDADETPQRVTHTNVTSEFLPLLGAELVLGRHFLTEETAPNGPKVVLLSHRLWQQRFAGDPEIIGRVLRINQHAHEVVGVLSPDLRLLVPADAWNLKDPELWLPMQSNFPTANRSVQTLFVLGRLKPGVTLTEGRAEMDALAARLRSEHAVHATSQMRIRIVPLREDLVKNVRPLLWTLTAAVGFVLLIAWSNVANLLIVRNAARRREMAVRAALGAGRARLVRQVLTESVLLGLLGGGAGMLLAPWASRLLLLAGPEELARLPHYGMDWTAITVALAGSLLGGVLFGCWPAFQMRRASLRMGMQEGSAGAGTASGATRSALVVCQVGISVVLLVGAGLLAQTFISLLGVRPGFDTGRIVTFKMSLSSADYPGAQAQLQFFDRMRGVLEALPEVEAVAATTQAPLTGTGALWPLAYDEETARKWESVTADLRRVTPGYFWAMGTRLLSGREFTEEDQTGRDVVAIVDESIARRAWGTVHPRGARIQMSVPTPGSPTGFERRWLEVVGVVEHTRNHDLSKQLQGQLYVPFRMFPSSTMTVTARTSADPAALAPALREQLAALDRRVPVYEMQTMRDSVDAALRAPRFAASTVLALAGLALLMAGVGLFGVVSYTVTLRTREIGLRMALGAQSGDVVRFIVAHAMRLALAGVAGGLAGAAALARLLEAHLYGVRPGDPLTFAAVAALLVGVTLAACYLPARRAARVDPVIALRYE